MWRKKEYPSLRLNTEEQEVSRGCSVSSSETVESISGQQEKKNFSLMLGRTGGPNVPRLVQTQGREVTKPGTRGATSQQHL